MCNLGVSSSHTRLQFTSLEAGIKTGCLQPGQTGSVPAAINLQRNQSPISPVIIIIILIIMVFVSQYLRLSRLFYRPL